MRPAPQPRRYTILCLCVAIEGEGGGEGRRAQPTLDFRGAILERNSCGIARREKRVASRDRERARAQLFGESESE